MMPTLRTAAAALLFVLFSMPGGAQTNVPPGDEPMFSNGMGFRQQSGQALYAAICAGCHMPQGQGARGAGFYPVLAKNPRLAAGTYPVYVVLNGLHGMPPFGWYLSDRQIAAVVNYVRTHFGNDYQDTVSGDDVAQLRPGAPVLPMH